MKYIWLSLLLLSMICGVHSVVNAVKQTPREHIIYDIAECMCEEIEQFNERSKKGFEEARALIDKKELSYIKARQRQRQLDQELEAEYKQAVKEKIEFEEGKDRLVRDTDDDSLIAIIQHHQSSLELDLLIEKIESARMHCRQRAEQQPKQ